MKIQIKNRFTDAVIVEGKFKDLKEAVEKNKADLSNADLSNADLSNADLQNANLWNADLSNANLRNANLRNAFTNFNRIKITKKQLQQLNIELSD